LGDLHLAGFGAFPASLGASLAALGMVIVFATFGGASLAAFHAEGAKRVRKLRIAGAQMGAKGADVGAVAADLHASLVAGHRATHGGALFALDQTGQTSVNASFTIVHILKKMSCERIFRHKGHCFTVACLYTILADCCKIHTF